MTEKACYNCRYEGFGMHSNPCQDCISRCQSGEDSPFWEPKYEDHTAEKEPLGPTGFVRDAHDVNENDGEWIDAGWDGDNDWQIDGRGHCWHVFKCSKCGAQLYGSGKTPYCHMCGAKMNDPKGD